MWGGKRDWDNSPVINYNATKTARRPLKIERREVKETPNLVFHLKIVSPIPLWRNWTGSAQHSILPRCSPLLNTIPVTPSKHKLNYLLWQTLTKNFRYNSYQVISSSSSNLFLTLTSTLLFVVTLITGPGNLPLIAITCKSKNQLPTRIHKIKSHIV